MQKPLNRLTLFWVSNMSQIAQISFILKQAEMLTMEPLP